MRTIRSLISLKTEKKNSFRLVPCESPVAYQMFTNHLRAAAILKTKGKCDCRKGKKVENSDGGQHPHVCSEYGRILI